MTIDLIKWKLIALGSLGNIVPHSEFPQVVCLFYKFVVENLTLPNNKKLDLTNFKTIAENIRIS